MSSNIEVSLQSSHDGIVWRDEEMPKSKVVSFPCKTFQEWRAELLKNSRASVGLGEPSQWSDEEIKLAVRCKAAIECHL